MGHWAGGKGKGERGKGKGKNISSFLPITHYQLAISLIFRVDIVAALFEEVDDTFAGIVED